MLNKIYDLLQSRLNSLSLIIKWIGVLLIFLSIIGVFNHSGRIKFYKNLEAKKEITADSKMAEKVMRYFNFTDDEIKRAEVIKLENIEGIVRFGDRPPNKLVAYGKHLKLKIIGDLVKFRQWAYSTSKLYDWLGFIFVALGGVVIDSFLYWQQRKK